MAVSAAANGRTMNPIVKQIPNTITCLNLFSGCLACVAALNGQYQAVALCIAFAAFFDFCDGMSARLLKAYSPMGKELDSLADMVSFGLAPGLIAYSIIGQMTADTEPGWTSYLPYLAFIIPIFSALRLAKFNLDERQTESFIGMPTPANAIFWVGISFLYAQYGEQPWFSPIVLIILIVGFSLLMTSEIPMFSLKIKSFSWQENRMQYILLIAAIASFFTFRIGGLAFTIVFYILLAVIDNSSKKTK